jgi:predicted nucleotidyltransferase
MKVREKRDVLSLIQSQDKRIRSLGVREISLFGSFSREEQNEQSDVDLLVVFDRGKKTFDSFMSLALFLEDLLGRKVELVTPESLSPYIGPRILKEAVPVPIGN